jgi:cysteinyl-tRNA synthetase
MCFRSVCFYLLPVPSDLLCSAAITQWIRRLHTPLPTHAQAAAGPCSCGHNHQHSEAAAAAAADSSADPTSSSSSSNPADFVRFWLHNGFVNVDSEKMSKSLGNFFTIRDVLKLYHPSALRWFLLSSQYRAPVNYTQKALEDASARLYYVLQTLLDVDAALAGSGEAGAAAFAAASVAAAPSSAEAAAAAAGVVPAGVGGELLASVVSALLDDLNSPAAVSAMSAPLKAINDLLTTKAGRKNPKR